MSAVKRSPVQAPCTSTAGLHQATHDVVAYADVSDVRSDRGYDAGDLMTQHRGHGVPRSTEAIVWSDWHSPAAFALTRTSRSIGSAIVMSSMLNPAPTALTTAALTGSSLLTSLSSHWPLWLCAQRFLPTVHRPGRIATASNWCIRHAP